MSADPPLPRSAAGGHADGQPDRQEPGCHPNRSAGLGHTRDVSMIEGEVEILEIDALETSPELVSDEELQKLSIGELKPHNAPITLVKYDPSWPRLFAREADRIRVVVGDAARRIEHVGSTSVPGLAAKPIIDILL
ncbi:MAG: GrpB family protein, partial [Pseudonocardiaceae bacterium]